MRRRLVITYALIVGAVAGILTASTIEPVGVGGGMDTGAPLYLGAIVTASIIVVDTILRIVLDRWPVRRRSSRLPPVPRASSSAGGRSTTRWAARPNRAPPDQRESAVAGPASPHVDGQAEDDPDGNSHCQPEPKLVRGHADGRPDPGADRQPASDAESSAGTRRVRPLRAAILIPGLLRGASSLIRGSP